MERPGVLSPNLQTHVSVELVAETQKTNVTTLSGGSLGSCVDEERS